MILNVINPDLNLKFSQIIDEIIAYIVNHFDIKLEVDKKYKNNTWRKSRNSWQIEYSLFTAKLMFILVSELIDSWLINKINKKESICQKVDDLSLKRAIM